MNTFSAEQSNTPNYACIDCQTTPTNSSPVFQPYVSTIVVDEVNKPIEVEDNVSPQLIGKASLTNSTSSTSVEEEKGLDGHQRHVSRD